MVEVVCNPPKRLIILECTQYPSVESLAKVLAVLISAGESIILKWAEGVAFTYTSLQPTTKELMEEFVKGVLYWSDVIYALLPEYKPAIRVGTLDIPIIDVSPNPVFREAARWMKKQRL